MFSWFKEKSIQHTMIGDLVVLESVYATFQAVFVILYGMAPWVTLSSTTCSRQRCHKIEYCQYV